MATTDVSQMSLDEAKAKVVHLGCLPLEFDSRADREAVISLFVQDEQN